MMRKNYQNNSCYALRKLTYCKKSNACACDVIDFLLFSLVYFCMTTVIRIAQYDHYIQRFFNLSPSKEPYNNGKREIGPLRALHKRTCEQYEKGSNKCETQLQSEVILC